MMECKLECVENAPLLEASRGSWKQGGARSQEGYRGTQSAKSVFGVLVLFGRCACVEVGVCGEAVRGAIRSLELAVGGESGRREGDADWRRGPAVSREPARSCEESRRELACHAEGPSSTAATLAAVGTGRRDSPHRGTSRVQVTCSVSRDSFGLPSPAP